MGIKKLLWPKIIIKKHKLKNIFPLYLWVDLYIYYKLLRIFSRELYMNRYILYKKQISMRDYVYNTYVHDIFKYRIFNTLLVMINNEKI